MLKMIRRLVPASLATAVLPVVSLAQEVTEEDAIRDLTMLSQVINWGGILQAVLIIFAAWLLLRFVDRIVEDLGRSYAEYRLTIQRINAFFHFFVYLATVVIIVLYSFDFSAQVLALFGGAAVVAIGFATRDLLASLVAGIMIIFDKPFQLGDRVSYGGEYGDILSIGLRSVKLRTLDDCTVTIPNNLFLSEVTSSANSGLLEMQTVVDFYVGLDQDVHQARELLREAAATSRYVYLPMPIVVIASQYPMEACIAMKLEVKAYVLDTKYEKDFQTDVVLRAHKAFEEHGIRPPGRYKPAKKTA